MQEQSRAEEIGRLVRQVNDVAEYLDHELGEEAGDFDFRVRVDLSEPSDALAALAFDEQKSRAQVASATHNERLQREELALHEVLEEKRSLQAEFDEKDRECRHMKARQEQLTRIFQEYREWSASQIEDAQKTTEATEDMHFINGDWVGFFP
eukprot:symbB.v1.2.002583.t1/scaffold135.1/size305288/3